MKGKRFLILLAKVSLVLCVSVVTVFLTVLFLVGGFVAAGTIIASESVSSAVESEDKTVVWGADDADVTFLSIPVTGLIVGSQDDITGPVGILSDAVTVGYDIKKQLYEAVSDEEIDGVILEINSPGGTIYGSRAISDGIAYMRNASDKPVVVFVAGLAASGGYWASLGSEMIVADYGSVIGSIGVITGPFKYYDSPIAEDGGLLTGGIVTEGGIESTIITAGESKDMGDPFRELTSDEIASLQQMVDNQYDEFVEAVSQHRNLDADFIRDDIKAYIYDSNDALEKNMIDKIGSRQDAFDALADLAEAGDDWNVVRSDETSGLVEALLNISKTQPSSPVQDCVYSGVVLAYFGNMSTLCR